MSKLIDSPFEVCPVCDGYVFLDQTYEHCAREHHCENTQCPLKRFFAQSRPPISAASEAKIDGDEKG